MNNFYIKQTLPWSETTVNIKLSVGFDQGQRLFKVAIFTIFQKKFYQIRPPTFQTLLWSETTLFLLSSKRNFSK